MEPKKRINVDGEWYEQTDYKLNEKLFAGLVCLDGVWYQKVKKVEKFSLPTEDNKFVHDPDELVHVVDTSSLLLYSVKAIDYWNDYKDKPSRFLKVFQNKINAQNLLLYIKPILTLTDLAPIIYDRQVWDKVLSLAVAKYRD